MKKENIAIVCDSISVYGGTERVIEYLSEILGNPPIYTSYYTPYSMPSSFNKLNIIESRYALLLKFFKGMGTIILPSAFEDIDLSGYKLIISVSASFAKCLSIPDDAVHISYVMTPPRFLWGLPTSRQSKFPYFRKIFYLINNYLRIKDFFSVLPDTHFIANSKSVARRISKFYRKNSTILYPFVDLDLFNINNNFRDGKYFLVVSRLEKYKNIELVINVCKRLSYKLKIVGKGSYRKYLESISDNNIEFLDFVNDNELINIINGASLFIMPAAEDFGMVMVEAQSCGKGVIAYGEDGATEIIVKGKTGEFFKTEGELFDILKSPLVFDKDLCRDNAKRFSKDKFRKDLLNIIKMYV